jgi:hypothetical protein
MSTDGRYIENAGAIFLKKWSFTCVNSQLCPWMGGISQRAMDGCAIFALTCMDARVRGGMDAKER